LGLGKQIDTIFCFQVLRRNATLRPVVKNLEKNAK